MIRGRVWVFGENIDTDGIIPARHCHTTKPEDLGQHAMEGADPGFAARVRKGDILAAGCNFGCGSSREAAPIALHACGVAAVVAASFARIFYRNAINVGLRIFECPEILASVSDGDTLAIDDGAGRLVNETSAATLPLKPFPSEILEIISAGGLVPYVRGRLGLGPLKRTS